MAADEFEEKRVGARRSDEGTAVLVSVVAPDALRLRRLLDEAPVSVAMSD
ncbi:hypothetical protein [Streptomyces caelestis]